MKTDDYAALVALDWGHTEHAFALRMQAGGEELGSFPATPEDLHEWLGALGERCGLRPVALALEGGRNAVVHALLAYPWLEVYPVHPATSERFRKAFTPSGAKDDLPDAQVLLTILAQHRDQLRRLVPDTAATRELAALTEIRRGAVDRRTQLAVELLSTLKNGSLRRWHCAAATCGRPWPSTSWSAGRSWRCSSRPSRRPCGASTTPTARGGRPSWTSGWP